VVEEVEGTKDGYAAWQALIAWYEESDLDHERLDALQTKITQLYTVPGRRRLGVRGAFSRGNSATWYARAQI
jgi:hypothetical protein